MCLLFCFDFFSMRQKVDMTAPKRRRQLTTWQVFCQVERRFHSRESNRRPLSWDLDISPPSSGSLGSSSFVLCVFTSPLRVYIDTKNHGRTMLFGVHVNVSIDNMYGSAMNHYIGWGFLFMWHLTSETTSMILNWYESFNWMTTPSPYKVLG